MDMLCQWRNGEGYRYVAVIAYFGRNQGTKDHAVLALQDVDERVRQEKILSQRDMQMAAILKSRFGTMTTVHLENDQCERFWLNESAKTNVGAGSYTHYYYKALESSICEEDMEGFRKVMAPSHLREQAGKTQDYSEEICQYRLDRSPVQWLEQHVTYIRRGGQVMVNILGRDITREKLQEEKRRKKAQEQAERLKAENYDLQSKVMAARERNQESEAEPVGEDGEAGNDGA